MTRMSRDIKNFLVLELWLLFFTIPYYDQDEKRYKEFSCLGTLASFLFFTPKKVFSTKPGC